MAAGLYIGSDRLQEVSDLRVVDPEVDPLVILNARSRDKVNAAVNRLAISRAFGLAGFTGLSEELSLPGKRIDQFASFYSSGEVSRLKKPLQQRESDAIRELSEIEGRSFEVDSKEFIGRSVSLDVPGSAFKLNTDFGRVTVRVGIDADFLGRARYIRKNVVEEIDALSSEFLGESGILIRTEGSKTILRSAGLFISTMEFD